MRCDANGDMPSGLHVTEIENAFLNTAELRVKREALIEGHDDSDLIAQVDAAIAKRSRKRPITVGTCDVCGGDQDKILPDGICMPCSISWEFHRANYQPPTETNQ